MELAGAVALVTGASAGIGARVAERLAAAGAQVVVHGRDAARTAEVAARVGGTPLVADLLTQSPEDVVAEAVAAHGRIDLLVANAGSGHSGAFDEMSSARIEEVVRLDLLSSIHLSRLLLPPMLERGRGRLTYVTSVAGRTGVAGEAVYAAAKAGLDVFAESLRLELTGTGVGVGVVVPSVVDTGFFEQRGRAYDRRYPRPVSAERLADVIVESIRHDRGEVWFPRWPRVATIVRSVAPGPYRRLSARFGEQVRGGGKEDDA